MKSFIAFLIMIVWSALIYTVMNLIGLDGQIWNRDIHDSIWSYLGLNLGAAIMLLIGLIGNVWIYFLVVGNQPWEWHKKQN